MKRKAEHPIRSTPVYLGNLGHMLCEWNKFLASRFVVVPSGDVTATPTFVNRTVDNFHGVIERKIVEICLERKNPAITPAKVNQSTRSWIRYPKMVKGTEQASNGHHRKPVQPLHNHTLATTDTDTPNKHVETVHCEGRVRAGEVGDCRKVFRGSQVDRFVQGCLEGPRNASKVWECLLAQFLL